MARSVQVPRGKKFAGVGRRLGAIPKKMKTVLVQRKKKQAAPLLKPTPMGRIVSAMVKDEGSSERMHCGIDWANHPRSTRNTRPSLVHRKTTSSVVAMSREAERMLGCFMSSANDATVHAGRSTLMKGDMDLVKSILSKNGASNVCGF